MTSDDDLPRITWAVINSDVSWNSRSRSSMGKVSDKRLIAAMTDSESGRGIALGNGTSPASP